MSKLVCITFTNVLAIIYNVCTQLRAPIVIAVKVQNIAYARVLIAELGGEVNV